MYQPFEQLPATSRTWVYQAERTLNSPEIAFIETQLKGFVESWLSHEQPVAGSFKIFHNRFIVLASNEAETGVSGCSIDKSVHFILSLGKQLNVDLLDRKVAYIADNEVHTAALPEIKKLVNAGTIQPETQIFNNTVQTLGELSEKWMVNARASWTAKYFATQAICD